MKYLLIALVILTSCSPVKRFNRLIEKYPYLLTQDTLVVHDTVSIYIPKVETDTMVTIQQLIDTVTIEKERLSVKTWYVPKEKKVYIEGKCDPVYITKVVERKIPIKYYEKYPFWKKLLNNLLAFLIIFVVLYLVYRIAKRYIFITKI